MARILTRPLFRKGGLSKTPRPSYRGGGVTAIRPGYRGGGRMTGIMSGIVDRQPYKTGSSWYKPWTWGGSQSYGDWLKQQIARTGQKPLESRIASKIRGAGRWLKGLPGREGISGIIARNFPKTAAVMEPIIPHYIAGKGALAQKELIDKASEKGLLDEMDFEYVDGRVLPTEETVQKIDPYKTPKQREMEASMEKGVPGGGDPKMWATENRLTGDIESDLMKAYKEYAPIFEKELGVSPEDTKKQLWMQLAKFGTGLMAQPGGDLVGAVGKAAEKPLEGAGEVVKEVSTAKRQAKLLALQTAIREGEPGQIGKAVKDIAKIYNVSQKDAAAIYEKWQRNDTTARAATNKRYAEQAKQLGLVHDNQNRFIAEANQLETDYPELIGQFNNKLPEDTDKWELGYYVSDTGKFVRVVEKDGKKVAIGMDEPGFSDKKKTKK